MIDSFTGEYRFLSNFYPCLIQVAGDPLSYPSVEHAYQAQKTLNVNDQITIARCKTPGEAKRLGRRVRLRPNWVELRKPIMRELVFFKFGHTELTKKLLATDDEILIEGNYWHDQFWGSCICPAHLAIPGENNLGEVIMEVRRQYATALQQQTEELQSATTTTNIA